MGWLPFQTAVRWLLLLVALASLAGCATTRYHERERLADRCMLMDGDDALVYMRIKLEAAREGSFGGYGAGSSAGGCGCQ